MDLKSFTQKVAGVAAMQAAFDAAADDSLISEAELLAKILEIVKPALDSICSPIADLGGILAVPVGVTEHETLWIDLNGRLVTSMPSKGSWAINVLESAVETFGLDQIVKALEIRLDGVLHGKMSKRTQENFALASKLRAIGVLLQ